MIYNIISDGSFPEKIVVTPSDIGIHSEAEIYRWLSSNIGRFTKDWDMDCLYYRTRFMFKTKEDMTLFVLRWL